MTKHNCCDCSLTSSYQYRKKWWHIFKSTSWMCVHKDCTNKEKIWKYIVDDIAPIWCPLNQGKQ